MSNAATLRCDHQMGRGASDGVDDHPCQLPAGAVARADFAADRKFCRSAHIGLTFTFSEGQICRSRRAVPRAKDKTTGSTSLRGPSGGCDCA